MGTNDFLGLQEALLVHSVRRSIYAQLQARLSWIITLAVSASLFIFPSRIPHQAAVDQPSKFDVYSWRKYMNKKGAAYRNQAMGLIRISLMFSKAAEQSFTQDAELSK